MTILAIDLGKYNSVACHYDPDSQATRFRTLRTTPAEMRQLFLREPVTLVVIEAGSSSGWIVDLCESLNLPIAVANTSGEAWKWKNVKRKTDRDDARKLAKLAAMGELPTVPMPAKPIREWKRLIHFRKRLVGERVRTQNRIRAVLVSEGLPAPMGGKAWTELGLAGLDALARPWSGCESGQLWRGELHLLLERYRASVSHVRLVESKLDSLASADARVALLETIPGVGTRTAEVIVSHLNDAKRFRSADEVSAYAGMVPQQYQSGTTDRRGRCTKRGPTLLRSTLVEAAWCCLRYNPWAQVHWNRLTETNGVSRKKAAVALGRKLLVRCWGMLKTGQRWKNPEGVSVAKAPTG
jgi:transposase